MGIEIKLTDDDAIKYLVKDNPDMKQMEDVIKTAKEYIAVLEERVEQLQSSVTNSIHTNLDDPYRHNIAGNMNKPAHHQEPSKKVLVDTAVVEEINEFANPSRTRWTPQEIKVIEYAMSRPETELNRKFTVLVEKLARSASSVRSKLAELNLYVNEDIIYHR